MLLDNGVNNPVLPTSRVHRFPIQVPRYGVIAVVLAAAALLALALAENLFANAVWVHEMADTVMLAPD